MRSGSVGRSRTLNRVWPPPSSSAYAVGSKPPLGRAAALADHDVRLAAGGLRRAPRDDDRVAVAPRLDVARRAQRQRPQPDHRDAQRPHRRLRPPGAVACTTTRTRRRMPVRGRIAVPTPITWEPRSVNDLASSAPRRPGRSCADRRPRCTAPVRAPARRGRAAGPASTVTRSLGAGRGVDAVPSSATCRRPCDARLVLSVHATAARPSAVNRTARSLALRIGEPSVRAGSKPPSRPPTAARASGRRERRPAGPRRPREHDPPVRRHGGLQPRRVEDDRRRLEGDRRMDGRARRCAGVADPHGLRDPSRRERARGLSRERVDAGHRLAGAPCHERAAAAADGDRRVAEPPAARPGTATAENVVGPGGALEQLESAPVRA